MTNPERDQLYTARWWAVNRLPQSQARSTIVDLLSDILDPDAIPHVDRDRLPNRNGHKPSKDQVEDLPVRGMRFALVVGHTPGTGAQSFDGRDEWATRKKVALLAQKKLRSKGYNARVFYRDGALDYDAAMDELGREIDEWEADAAVELHYNWYKGAHGFEVLCISDAGEILARAIADGEKQVFPEMHARRDDGVYRISAGAGAGFLRAPRCPAALWEPFFASDPIEARRFLNDVERESDALVEGLEIYARKTS